MVAFSAVDITIMVLGGVYIICAWLSVALYQKKLKKNKDELFKNMDDDKPPDDPGVVSSGPPSNPDEPAKSTASSGPSVVSSGPDSEPSDLQQVPSYQDEDVQTGSEFPSIQVTSKSDSDKNMSPSSTTTGQTESIPSQDSNVSGFWTGSQPPPTQKSYSTSSTGDTNSLESANRDVSGFWSSKGSGPKRPPPGGTQTGDEGDTEKPESGITTSSSGNTLSNPSENSQVSGFWSGKSKSAGGDAPKGSGSAPPQKKTQPASGKGEKASDKASQDSEFWAPTEDAPQSDNNLDYDTMDNSSVTADQTIEAKK